MADGSPMPYQRLVGHRDRRRCSGGRPSASAPGLLNGPFSPIVALLHMQIIPGVIIVLISTIAVVWLVMVVAFVFIWGGFRAHARSVEGLDDVLYRNGLDEASLAE